MVSNIITMLSHVKALIIKAVVRHGGAQYGRAAPPRHCGLAASEASTHKQAASRSRGPVANFGAGVPPPCSRFAKFCSPPIIPTVQGSRADGGTFTGHFQADATFLHVVGPLTCRDLPPAIDSSGGDKLKARSCAHTPRSYDPGLPADLMTLPTRGYGTFRRFILGSVTPKVLHDAQPPVWTGAHMEQVAPLETIVFRNVLCALDLGKQSVLALQWATRFAAEFQAKLTIALAIVGPSGVRDEVTAQIGQLQASAGWDAEVRILSGEVPASVHPCAEDTHRRTSW
jgi:hypothetical protein